MIVPGKFVPYEHSIIFKMLKILESLKDNPITTISNLYKSHENNFDGIDEFIFSLDALYVLNKIEVDFEKGLVSYVD